MTDAHRPRIAAGILVLAAAVAAWLSFAPDRGAETAGGAPVATGSAALAPGAARLAAHAGDPETGAVSRSAVDPDGGGAAAPAADTGPPVHLRVLLRIMDDNGEERIPPDCAGWVVRAQSWLEATGEVFPHEARADARGVAEFSFAGFVHVDWVGCAPPAASGLGFSQISEHHDFDAGSDEEWTLPLLPGGAARGRVEQIDGRPAPGALVHAFDPGWDGDADDWTPGFLSARAGADGEFRFDGLGAGTWTFAVEPGEWMQIEPPLGSASEGQGWAEVAPGALADAGVLRVHAASALELRVVDADGIGMQGIYFGVMALRIESEQLHDAGWDGEEEAESDPTAEWTARFLAGEDPESWLEADAEPSDDEDSRLEWPYDGAARTTRADGRCSWHLPPGRYRVECWSPVPGAPQGTFEPFETTVPGPPITLRTPLATVDWSGRLVDEHGAPAEGASLTLSWTEDGSEASWEAESDAAGVFHFAGVPALRDCELRAMRSGLVSCAWRVSLTEPPDLPFCLPGAAPLTVRFLDGDGKPIPLDFATPHLTPLRVTPPPIAPGARAGTVLLTRVSTVAGELRAYDCQQGEYEFRLTHPRFSFSPSPKLLGGFATDTIMATEGEEIGRWRVMTGPEPNLIRLDAAQVAKLALQTERHSGVVRDAETLAPLAGVTVSFAGSRMVEGARSGPDGSFTVEIAAADLVLRADAPGYEPLMLDAAAVRASGGVLDLRLVSAGALVHLRVLDRDGRRLPPCSAELLFPGAAGFPPASPAEGLSGQLDEGELSFHSKRLGAHRLRLSFAPGVQAEASFDLAATRGQSSAECRIGLSLAELRAALLAARR